RSGERTEERGPSSPQPSPPSDGGEGGFGCGCRVGKCPGQAVLRDASGDPSGARAQLDPPDLSADRLWQFRDKLDFARILVRRGDAFAVVLQLAPKFLAGCSVAAQHHERLYDLTAH